MIKSHRSPLSSLMSVMLRYSFLMGFVVITISPLLWMISVALKTSEEQTRNPIGFPSQPTLENFVEIVRDPSMIRYMGNSIIVTILSVVIVVILGSLAGYALARIDFKSRGIVLLLFLAAQWVPLVALVIPLLITMQYLGLYGTKISLILAYASANLGLATFLMRGFFRSIPQELLDASVLDGCNEFQSFRHVMLPLVKAGLSVVAIMAFISAWNEYFIALVLVNSAQNYTLPLGISTLKGFYGTDWPNLTAALFLATLPTLIIYIVFSESFIESTSRSVGFGGR